MRQALNLATVAVLAAVIGAWGSGVRGQPEELDVRAIYIRDFAEAGEVRFFSVDADSGAAGAQCPDGWEPLAAARGRYIVGVTANGTLGGTAGPALGDTDNVRAGGIGATQRIPPAALGAHTHGWNGSFSGSSGAISVRYTRPTANYTRPSLGSINYTRPTANYTRPNYSRPTATLTRPSASATSNFIGSPTAITHSHGFTRPTATFFGNSVTPTAGGHRHTYTQTLATAGTFRVGTGSSRTLITATRHSAVLNTASFGSVGSITPTGTVTLRGGAVQSGGGSITPAGTVSTSILLSGGAVTLSGGGLSGGGVTLSGGGVSGGSLSGGGVNLTGGGVSASNFTPSGSVTGAVAPGGGGTTHPGATITVPGGGIPAPSYQVLPCRAVA